MKIFNVTYETSTHTKNYCLHQFLLIKFCVKYRLTGTPLLDEGGAKVSLMVPLSDLEVFPRRVSRRRPSAIEDRAGTQGNFLLE